MKKKLEEFQAWRLKKDKLGRKIDPKKMSMKNKTEDSAMDLK